MTKKWWEYLDWSEMEQTFKMLPDLKRQEILEKGHWRKGKGIFTSK